MDKINVRVSRNIYRKCQSRNVRWQRIALVVLSVKTTLCVGEQIIDDLLARLNCATHATFGSSCRPHAATRLNKDGGRKRNRV